MKTMRAFHAEMLARFSATDAKVDAATVSFEAIQDLKRSIKPECLEA